MFTTNQDDRVSDPVAWPPQNLIPAILPEFIRLPRSSERCQISGLSRAGLNNLILGPNPPVRSVCLRKRGALRGVRLIVVQSLIEYLYSLEDAASPFRNN